MFTMFVFVLGFDLYKSTHKSACTTKLLVAKSGLAMSRW